MIRRLLRLIPRNLKNRLKVSFLGRFIMKLYYRSRILRRRPIGVTIELTSRCNLACTYCPKSGNLDMRVGDMPFDDFKMILDSASEYVMELEQVCLVGFGEPLLYPKLFDAIKYTKKVYPKTKVTITTNGRLLDEQVGANLIASGLDQMTISLNTITNKRYEELVHSKGYDSLVENTKNFLLVLNEGGRTRTPHTFVQILDIVNSEAEMTEFVEYWQPYLSPNAEIQIQPFVNWAGEVNLPDNSQSLSESKVERYPCPHLFATATSPIITREGLALACCMAFPLNEDLILGSAFGIPLEELYMGEKFKRLCGLHLKGEFNKIPACARCDAWRTGHNVWFWIKFLKWSRWL